MVSRPVKRRKAFPKRKRAPVRRRAVKKVVKDPYSKRYREQKGLVLHTVGGHNPIPKSLDLSFFADGDCFLPGMSLPAGGFATWVIVAYPYQPFAGLTASPTFTPLTGTALTTANAKGWTNYMINPSSGIQANGLFAYATPMSSKISIQLMSASTGQNFEVVLVPQTVNLDTVPTNIQQARLAPNSRSVNLLPYERANISCFTSITKMEGLTRSQVISDATQFRGSLSTAPSEAQYYSLCIQSYDNATNAGAINMKLGLSVNCYLFAPARTGLNE